MVFVRDVPAPIVYPSIREQPSGVLTLENLQFCEMLQGGLVRVHTPKTTQTDTLEWVADLIDSEAQVYYKSTIRNLQNYDRSVDEPSLKRLACFQSVDVICRDEGIALVQLPRHYFADIEWSHGSISERLQRPGCSREFSIVYLLLGLDTDLGVDALIEALDDPNALFLIHFVKPQQKSWKQCNVIVAPPDVFPVDQGQSKTLFAQLQALLFLHDYASWDYVVFLSNEHYPFANTKTILLALQKSQNSHIPVELVFEADEEQGIPIVLRLQSKENPSDQVWLETKEKRLWPFVYPQIKHFEWMALKRNFVDELKTDEDMLRLLAFVEHIPMPHHLFFATFAKSTKRLDMAQDSLTLMALDSQKQPMSLDLEQITSNSKHMFAYRVLPDQVGIRKWMNEHRDTFQTK